MKERIVYNQVILLKTASIENSIYNSEWVNNSNKFKKMIMMIMMRTTKEYKFTAYGILILNREQMAKVLFNFTVHNKVRIVEYFIFL